MKKFTLRELQAMETITQGGVNNEISSTNKAYQRRYYNCNLG